MLPWHCWRKSLHLQHVKKLVAFITSADTRLKDVLQGHARERRVPTGLFESSLARAHARLSVPKVRKVSETGMVLSPRDTQKAMACGGQNMT